MQGLLELDYSTFKRPSGRVKEINDERADEIEVNTSSLSQCLSFHPSVTQITQELLLHALRMWNYSTSSADLFRPIVQQQYCLANHLVNWTCCILEHPSLHTFTSERRCAWAEDLFVLGHEMVFLLPRFLINLLTTMQVTDWPNVWSSCRRLPYSNLKTIIRRIGILQLMNPMCVEGYYELDLSEREDAVVARVLVDLSVKEPGENWIDETYNGNGFELPATWVQKIPEKGILTLTYAVESWAIKKKARSNWMQYFQVKEFEREEEDDFLGCCSCKLLPLLRKKGRNAYVDLGWLKLRNIISGDIKIGLFVDSNSARNLWINSQLSNPLKFINSQLSNPLQLINAQLTNPSPLSAATSAQGLDTAPSLQPQVQPVDEDDSADEQSPSIELLEDEELEDALANHGGWRQGGKFVFGVHVKGGRNM